MELEGLFNKLASSILVRSVTGIHLRLTSDGLQKPPLCVLGPSIQMPGSQNDPYDCAGELRDTLHMVKKQTRRQHAKQDSVAQSCSLNF